MPPKPKAPKGAKPVEMLVHADTRRNIPTAELQSIAQRMEEAEPVQPARYARATPLPKGETHPRNADLDPQVLWRGARIRLTNAQRRQLQDTGEIELGDAQLVWRGKDAQDWSDLVVNPPPIYIQEKVHPKAIIDGLQKDAQTRAEAANDAPDLFADFNGLSDPEARLEFYQHDQHWSNRMILGDSLQVMASLAEREGLRGKVQCIFLDPPYGIKFNSNWQVSTLSRDVKDGKREDVSREPEQVKAFRDTWKDSVHSYLTYLRDRLSVARELLTDTGSIFLQIGDENIHRVRGILDEVFGEDAFISQIAFTKGATGLSASGRLPARLDYVLWYKAPKRGTEVKFRQLYDLKSASDDPNFGWVITSSGEVVRKSKAKDTGIVDLAQDVSLTKPGPGAKYSVPFEGRDYTSGSRWWGTTKPQLERAIKSGRIIAIGNSLRHLRYLKESSLTAIGNLWDGLLGQSGPIYVVQTNEEVVKRCVLMATDPGDLVLDPTCGSGTTAAVCERWGRRWITIDTSRVALALARTRLMAAQYPYFLLADSRDGLAKEQELSGRHQSDRRCYNEVRQGFVYERASQVTLKAIANNAEIDALWDEARPELDQLRGELNESLGRSWEDWEIPRECGAAWPGVARDIHKRWWAARLARQRKMDASIARRADIEYLYDRPYEDRSRVRVSGPFTVESLSPHRVVPADEDDLLSHAPSASSRRAKVPRVDFATMVLENLRTAGVHQSQKAYSIRFTTLAPWPGSYIGAEGRFMEGETERRAGILIGPEFGTLSRIDLVTAAREASEARFDVLISCAFNYDAHASELAKLGPLSILKARMNPDLHMADDLKNTGKGNLFVVFGEPDLVVEPVPDQPDHVRIRILGVDVFDPQTGDIRSGDTKSIAAWFIDTDYNEESFYVRHAYFLGANDPYQSLKATLKAEIDETAWATLYRDTSRPFSRPERGRIAVKVINHFGDEVMKVFTL